MHESDDTLRPPTAVEPAPSMHFIAVDRGWTGRSATLPAVAVRSVEAALRGGPWYRDRWSQRPFRRAVLDALRTHAPGGLVILGPGLPFDVPPPFDYFFEPIAMGANDERLRTLSGEAETRQERSIRWLRWIFGALGAMLVAGLVLAGLHRGAWVVAALVVPTVALLALALGGKGWLGLETWYLLPGSVAIVNRRRARARDRLSVRSRFDTCAIFRLVSTGKFVVMILELVSRDGCRRTAVSDRDAISFLAAWQSPVPPPGPDKLAELTG